MSDTIEFKPPSSDGTIIVKLAHPFKWRGDDCDKVTIPHLRGKHLATLPVKAGEEASVGQIVEWASSVVIPKGVMGEMHPSDALAIGLRLMALLGESLATGEAAAP